MKIDRNEFFRQASKRINSSLDFKKGLERFRHYIKGVMPADLIVLSLFDSNLGTLSEIAQAGRVVGYSEKKLISLPDYILEYIKEALANPEPLVMLENDPRKSEFFNRFPQILEDMPEMIEKEVSRISMSLVIEGHYVANLGVVAKGLNRFTQEHADLLVMLNESFAIAVSNTLAHKRVLQLQAILEDDNRFLQDELRQMSGNEIIGEEFGLREVMQHVHQVAAQNSPVMLYGETGVGKDMIANALHYSSKRKNKPFVKVNCGAIPDNLIDSELFGHEKGSFTGAIQQKRGRFERADHGTILLDEVGELPPKAQVRLLRVLQNKEFERVGGTKTINVDTRVIAATNRNLEEMVKRGEFREDLWFRLNVFPIIIPPLRQRTIDIPALVHYFIEKKTMELKLPAKPLLSSASMDTLVNHSWPGNVRELENLVERAMILFHDGVLHFEKLLSAVGPVERLSNVEDLESSLTLDEVIVMHIRRILVQTQGKIHGKDGAAKRLGINPNTLRSKMKKLGIPFEKEAYMRRK